MWQFGFLDLRKPEAVDMLIPGKYEQMVMLHSKWDFFRIISWILNEGMEHCYFVTGSYRDKCIPLRLLFQSGARLVELVPLLHDVVYH
jgi:hypothetical protein